MIINIDWLQLHCRGTFRSGGSYTCTKLKFSTNVFSVVHDVYYLDRYFLSIQSVPKSSVLHDDTLIIKVINSMLYSADMWDILDRFLASNDILYIGITRIDVCADFLTFKNNLKPQNLIKMYMSGKLRKVGISKGSTHFTQKKTLSFETLKFGSPSSLVSAYLYNKSLELRQVKSKPYISDQWASSSPASNGDFWRLEFAIKGNNMELVNAVTGVVDTINLQLLRNSDKLNSLYFSLLAQYFRFKQDYAGKNISRAPDLVLFDDLSEPHVRSLINIDNNGTRSDKIMLRQLDNINNQMRSYAKTREPFLTELITEFAMSKGLVDYYLERCNGQATDVLSHIKSCNLALYENLKAANEKDNCPPDLYTKLHRIKNCYDVSFRPRLLRR